MMIRDNMSRHLMSVRNTKLPFWLLIYPEGSLNTTNNKIRSDKYAKKMGLKEEPVHIILPKSRGLLHSLSALRPEVHTLVDITVGYSGITADQIPYDEYLIENVFFKGKAPPSVHMHVRKFDVDKIPGFIGSDQDIMEDNKIREDFDTWLRARFMEKDALLKTFYENGKFIPDILPESVSYELEAAIKPNFKCSEVISSSKRECRQVVDVSPELQDWIMCSFIWYSLVYITAPLCWWLFMKLISIFLKI